MPSASPIGFLLTAFLFASASWAAHPADRVGEEAANGPTPPAPHRPANRLARETSPYLLLHAHNPIDWYPWGPEAFEKARQENKPIFLSIGYSSCFWCHVMERESFSDEEIAAYMNEHFVNIKVDREERPDVDDIYMLALQIYHQVIGSPQGGGWPLSMFLTPTGKPIAGGTYFPPRTKNGLPGFLSVAKQIQQVWSEQPEQMQAAADVIAQEVRRASLPAADLQSVPLDRTLVELAVGAVKEQYDPKFGGVDFDARRPGGPKFPVPTRLMLLQSQLAKGADPQLADILETTLDHMLRGGIRDHLGGGFHRYSTDRQWLVPHFEKMLYDNAQLAEVYARASARTGREDYREAAEGTFAFVLREMTDPQGAFYSALDAETDGVEGQHYVWSPEEIVRVLGEADAALFNEIYGVTPPMFFEHGYVLHLPQSLAQAAEARSMPEDELRDRLSALQEKLLAARAQRPPLLKDDKILTSWNGLMIRAMARGGELLDRPDLIEAAQRAARCILSTMRDDEGRLMRTHRQQLSHLNAYLDDYAFLVDGLLALHDVTGRPEWLAEARQLTDDQIDLFWDDDAGAFYFTSDHHEELLARTKNAYDSVLPSGNSVSVRNLVRLGRLTGEAEYSERARQTLEVFAANMKQQPGSMTFLALALDEYLDAVETSDAQTGGSPPLPAAQDDAGAGGIVIVAQKPPQQSSGSSRQGDREPLVPAAQSDPREKDAKVSATAYLSVNKLTAGQTARVAVILTVAEGWHINANPAQPDFLEPTELALQAAHKTTLLKVEYPKGRNFVMEGFDEPLSVYEKQVVIRGTLKVPPQAAGKTERIDLEVHYQACDDRRCLRPTEVTLSFEVPVVAAGTPVKPINQRLFRSSN